MEAAPLAVLDFFPVKPRNCAFNAAGKYRGAAGIVVVYITGQNYVSLGVNVYHCPGFALPVFFFCHYFEVTD